ncbi:F-actin capping protein, alpha subunit [Conidiobolus coronatus NRRL 28638]|uniref:F-actin-capping protein subunit alpha n=1 Tax=Conidiobolus coronatus (strain ATCC 28846 / CBS 209.66 / NRRL 28638) TaxID=796925 RepID=A0A137PHD9_CONC2|nr:F-actin capping protein, alpha subunit [Conidiobolus coronatus NRRL 28638]|eukprot:KXN74417.1 F-actin capping protein, alpha subunit [Conidiobolus coronatus NRRL 28638]
MSEFQDLNPQQKVELASEFLLDAPPGELNDVIGDIRGLINDDEALEEGILPSLQKYNLDNFTPIELPGTEDKVLLSNYNLTQQGYFVDPRSQQKFKFDHLRQAISDIEAYEPDDELDVYRASLDTEVQKYTSQYYEDGKSAVYIQDLSLVVLIIGTKLNSKNYWNGQWKSIWTVTPNEEKLTGSISTKVHYYEEGNVQLDSSREVDLSLEAVEDPDNYAKNVIKQILKSENEYQTSLNEGYTHLAERAFSGLRRALPLTKTKMDWSKVMSYKIGSELNK